jgi:predicted  nucleic acid-binding Zn-ribbon protein
MQLKKPPVERDNMATADNIEAEIEDLRNTIVLLGEAVTAAKTVLDTAKKAFDKEAKKPENGKAEGQSMRDSLESIMKENGLNFGDYNGRDMQGNACREFLEKRVSIFA